MNTVQKTLLALTALTSVAVVIPAVADAAQPVAVVRVDAGRGWDRHDDRNMEINSRIDRLQDRIRMGESTRHLSRREAARLDNQLGRIISNKRMYERSGRGLDPRETAMLNQSLDRLSADARLQARDGNRW